jgi:FMN phosphatase YigB (HAD superfamily)
MRIYLDFDNTLVATRIFFDNYYRPLLVASGSTKREIETSYAFFANGTTTKGELFSPRRQMEILGWREPRKEEALTEIENIIREQRAFIFPEVVETLSELRRRGHTLILLTFGDQEFQKQKITASGIAHFFDEIIVTNEDKGEVLARDTEGEQIVFVDDKVEFMERLQANLPSVITFHMCRKEIGIEACQKGQCRASHEIMDLEGLTQFVGVEAEKGIL